MNDYLENTDGSIILEPRILLEKGMTILEWNSCDWNVRNIKAVHIERMIEDNEWEPIGLLDIPANSLIVRFVDKSVINANLKKNLIKIHYRLKITERNGKVTCTPSAYFDLWWKKYLELLDNPGQTTSETSAEVFRLVDTAIKLLVRHQFKAALFSQDLNVSFVIDEARQEIFEKLLSDKYMPAKGYSGFVNFITKIGRNWIINLLRKEYKYKNEPFDELYCSHIASPEQDFIEEEEKEAVYNRFRAEFSSIVEEFWLTQPKYALVVELWLKHKKLAAEDIFEGILGQSIDAFNRPGDPDNDPESGSKDDNRPPEGRASLYNNIIDELESLGTHHNILEERLRKMTPAVRKLFLSELAGVDRSDSKTRNRVRQWLFRGLTIIRVKMHPGLDVLSREIT